MWITLGVVCATALATIRWLSTRLNSMREQVKYYENHWQAIAIELAQEHISAHEAPMKQEIAELTTKLRRFRGCKCGLKPANRPPLSLSEIIN